jgi:regulator of replication initiation timing
VEALSRKLNRLDDCVYELQMENKELRSELSNLREKLSVIGVDEIPADTHDKRALRVRVWLYEQANDSHDGKVAMTKHVARGVLGNIPLEDRYEAMRRAVDGTHGATKGESSLSPIQGIEFEQFDGDRSSRVRIDLEALVQQFGRNIIQTEEGAA